MTEQEIEILAEDWIKKLPYYPYSIAPRTYLKKGFIGGYLAAMENYRNQSTGPREAYLCPKCQGQGRVSKPPYLPVEVQHWSGTGTDYEYDVCNGAKVLYKSTPLQPSAKPS